MGSSKQKVNPDSLGNYRFAVSMAAFRLDNSGRYEMKHSVGVISRKSMGVAEAFFLELSKDMWLPEDGWRGHSVDATLVE